MTSRAKRRKTERETPLSAERYVAQTATARIKEVADLEAYTEIEEAFGEFLVEICEEYNVEPHILDTLAIAFLGGNIGGRQAVIESSHAIMDMESQINLAILQRSIDAGYHHVQDHHEEHPASVLYSPFKETLDTL